MHKYSLEEISDPFFVDNLLIKGLDKGHCIVTLGDGPMMIPTRALVNNVMLWRPLFEFKITPTKRDIFKFKYITPDHISELLSVIYFRLLEARPDIHHMILVTSIAEAIDNLERTIEKYICYYMPTMDIIGLCDIIADDKCSKFRDINFGVGGTDVVEAMMKQITTDFDKLIATEGEIADNMLLPYMQAKTLRPNMIPQMMVAYGPRSDINDHMKKHSIPHSAVEGLQTVADYATESLSAKKALYLNRSAIKKSQYFGRKLRLAVSSIKQVYPGDCGNTKTIKIFISKSHAHNFIGKTIIENKQKVVLSKHNIDNYKDKQVDMITLFGCKHTDGFCEACAGYANDMLIKFLPPEIMIGLFAASQLVSKVTQKILSSKHLISTKSKMYVLPERAKTYLCVSGDNIYWDKKVFSRLKGCSIRISKDSTNPISDLDLDILPNSETFSRISYIEIVKDGEVIDNIPIESDIFVPYLSEATLEYMKSVYNEITQTDDYINIPIKDMDISQEFLKYHIINDDMVSYTKRVIGFLTGHVADYTSVSKLLEDFSNIVYSKSSVNFFYIEVVLRAFMIENSNNYTVPYMKDPDNVRFGNLDAVITESSISMKLSFERLKDYLSNPNTYTRPRQVGFFGPFFGLV